MQKISQSESTTEEVVSYIIGTCSSLLKVQAVDLETIYTK